MEVTPLVAENQRRQARGQRALASEGICCLCYAVAPQLAQGELAASDLPLLFPMTRKWAVWVHLRLRKYLGQLAYADQS